MAIPKTVQRQLDEAEALAKTLVQPDLQNVVTDASQLLAANPPAEPPAPPAAPAATTPPPEDWEQKYKTAVGRYNAELPPLRAQVKTFESQVSALTEQIRALTAATQAKPEPPAKPTVDPRDVESFGADLMDMVQRYTTGAHQTLRAEFNDVVAKFDGRLQQVEQIVTGVSQKTDSTLESQFYASLAGLAPTWQKINESESWLAWLAEIDPIYGVPRQAALDDAFQRMDVSRTAEIFRQYERSRPARPSASAESLVTPSGGASNPAPAAPVQKQLVSQKFVQTFYNDQARGKYRGREAEAARIEAEINTAAEEGRIV